MILLAILLPCVSFLLRGKILHFIVCLFLQITLIGWLPAAIWAVVDLQNSRANKRMDRLIKSLKD
ncbi:MAG: YqaE/Pmp3 family membrane protein [Puia sp.]|nr:YqaE/Pmp3 family membrane protein [Puia sp.]